MLNKFPEHIRSFVMRSGHITDAQRNTRERLLPVWGIPYQAEPIDLKEFFGRTAKNVLEIGFREN